MKQLLGSNIMNLATCDHVLDFIKGHKLARYLQLTWYGGEPLIGAAVIKHFHIQVTLDGMENTHDKRRMRNDKSGTFRTILDIGWRITSMMRATTCVVYTKTTNMRI